MNLESFYIAIQELLPAKRESEDFRAILDRVLAEYLKLIKSLDDDVTRNFVDWGNRLERIEKLINGIKKSVKRYYEGLHGSAFNVIKNQMLGYHGMVGVLDSIKLHKCSKDEFFFRGRLFENNRHRTYREMFHISLKERGKVRTQRYSAPGYPCLYLGSTIYACWEELGQPRFDDMMISAYKATKEFQLFDLRTPTKAQINSNDLEDILLRLPLILACSFVVEDKDKDADFKPEYIIPHLLTEVIIQRNRNQFKELDFEKLVLGVIFTSTHPNSDIDFPAKVLDNIAIPVLDVDGSNEYCNVLSAHFHLTDPTCYEYEEIKSPFEINGGRYDLRSKEMADQNYKLSKMGQLEKRITERGNWNRFTVLMISIREATFSHTGEVIEQPNEDQEDF